MRNFACLLFIAISVVWGCAKEQPTISVTAEANWLNPVTSETKRAVIRPLVRIQPADESERPKTLQTFGGLNWKRWQAASDVTLTIVIRDAAKRLSGIEIEFDGEQKKFVPAQNRGELKATMAGNLFRNEIVATVFVHEGERVLPKWRLFIHPEKRGQLVRFLFELPATFGENPKLTLPEFLQHTLKVDRDGFFSEISPDFLLQSGTLSRTIPVRSFRWINIVSPFPQSSKLPQHLATDEDKSIESEWVGLVKELPKSLHPQEKMKVHLSGFLEGKIVVRYEATAQVLVEVKGEIAEDTDTVAVRKQLQKTLTRVTPVAILPNPKFEVHHRARETGQIPSKEEFLEAQERWRQQSQKRNKRLEDALKQVAQSLNLTNLSVRVIAERFVFEPKSVERRLRPLTITLHLKLQGNAWCDYHRQTHIVPVSGKVRLTLSNFRFPFSEKVRQQVFEGITFEPVEANVPVEGAEVKVPFVWFHPIVGGNVDVEVQAKGWRLKQPFRPSIGVVPPKRPCQFTLELEPTKAETATFLLELPQDAQLLHATIVVQDERSKIVASKPARWLENYGGHGIVLTELPYGTYQVAAEGSFIVNGKKQTFSFTETIRVQSYHTVAWLGK